ncbi:MAG TPA: hypothetical protein DCY20_08270, partial [Firmicutes bacterium]|nr:hypothetical protein [Bacillota bacterium]
MKKVIVINSSINGEDSATLKMTNAFIDGMKDHIDCIVEYIHLKHYDINLCTGCLVCWRETPGKCCIKDDMASIIKKYKSADFVIFNSCVHCYGTTALDRIFTERLLPVVEIKPVEGEASQLDYIFKSNRPANNKHIIIYSCASLNVKEMMKPITELYKHIYNNECIMLAGS